MIPFIRVDASHKKTFEPIKNMSFEVLYEQVDQQTLKYRFKDTSGNPLTFKNAIHELKVPESSFPELLNQIFKQHVPEGAAVFWECAPVRSSNFESSAFEFVLILAPSLASKISREGADVTAFEDKFRQNAHASENSVITFDNLGKDASLIVPYPPTDRSTIQTYGHLASFIQRGSRAQVANLWKKIGERFEERMRASSATNSWLWLSTSGLGVSWLHIRIDSFPKYYNYQPYKNV